MSTNKIAAKKNAGKKMELVVHRDTKPAVRDYEKEKLRRELRINERCVANQARHIADLHEAKKAAEARVKDLREALRNASIGILGVQLATHDCEKAIVSMDLTLGMQDATERHISEHRREAIRKVRRAAKLANELYRTVNAPEPKEALAHG